MPLRHTAARLVANLLSVSLRAGGRGFYRAVVDALWEREPFIEDPAAGKPLDVKLFYPGLVEPAHSERPMVERIFAAYAKAKASQALADPVFLPASGWQGVIDSAFAPLTEGLATGDFERFHYFLANFRSWPRTTGMEPSQQISEYARDARRRAHFEQRVVAPILRWWLRSESQGRDLSALAMPRHGNQCGTIVDGHLVAPSSVFCEVSGRLLAGFVPRFRPVIAELGAGFGKLFYFTSRHLDRFCYVDLDLPEALCCAAYFLMRTFPDRRFLLYGEGELTQEALEQNDFLLFPSFEIASLPDRRVDLFINENSLGVMSAEACRLFVREICRSADALYHRNAESSRLHFADGSASLVNREYPIPPSEFEQVIRYCDISRVMSSGRLNFDTDMYWYYYRRRRVVAAGG